MAEQKSGQKTDKTGIVEQIEETMIALLLGLMTALTFANVVARYAFNSNILWAVEMTVFMFAWLVLLGSSYAVKKHAHLGVDAIINMLAPPARRVMALISVAACLMFAVLMLKGAYDYWAVYADLPPTSGRWFPTGLNWAARSQSFYEVQDVPMQAWLAWLEPLINEGEAYEKIPKVVPYLVMPVSMALLTLRFVQAAIKIWRGDMDRLVTSHEVEEELEEIRSRQEDQG